MNHRMKMVAVATVLCGACSYTQTCASFHSLGRKATITCYSGDRIVFAGRSMGAVVSKEGGQHSFQDSATAQLVEVTGTCVTVVDNQ